MKKTLALTTAGVGIVAAVVAAIYLKDNNRNWCGKKVKYAGFDLKD